MNKLSAFMQKVASSSNNGKKKTMSTL